jgi:dihydrofolate synthase/folylpolyglutamate synthase
MALERAPLGRPLADDTVRAALAGVWWPGRFDIVSRRPLVVLDGAHNPAAARALRGELDRILAGRKLRLVFGVMRDKNWRGMWEALGPVVSDVIVTQATLPRSLGAETLASAIGGDVPVRICAHSEDAVAQALDGAGPTDAILVSGSLFLVGEVYPFFLRQWGRRHLFDPWNGAAADGTEAPA